MVENAYTSGGHDHSGDDLLFPPELPATHRAHEHHHHRRGDQPGAVNQEREDHYGAEDEPQRPPMGLAREFGVVDEKRAKHEYQSQHDQESAKHGREISRSHPDCRAHRIVRRETREKRADGYVHDPGVEVLPVAVVKRHFFLQAMNANSSVNAPSLAGARLIAGHHILFFRIWPLWEFRAPSPRLVAKSQSHAIHLRVAMVLDADFVW